jgi:hypothetical protein
LAGILGISNSELIYLKFIKLYFFKKSEEDKFKILDVKAKLSTSEIVDREIQKLKKYEVA